MGPRHLSREDGMSLIEIMIAMVILVIMVTTFGRYMGAFLNSNSKAGAVTTATAVARERMELVRADPRYGSLVARYGTGASADTTGFPGYPSMKRKTTVIRDQSGSPARDITKVTVLVTMPGLTDTVRLTTTLARP